MDGMRLGGIDPSILRELSGVYKPFAKALKELISNAFDADAEKVAVEFANDFSFVTVADDGCGMNPFDFRNDFTRIGGGSRRWSGERTKRGRLRIGSKGIGFLALARYCQRLRVESGSDRVFSTSISLESTPTKLRIIEQLGIPIPLKVLDACVSFTGAALAGRRKKFTDGRGLDWDPKTGTLSIDRQAGPVAVTVKVNCKRLRFLAMLDFEKLLRLADNADLEKLDDFATIEVSLVDDPNVNPRTLITAEGLRPFVRKDLRSERRKGFVRNIGSRGGFEQFVWSLSRCTPISYKLADGDDNAAIVNLLSAERVMALGDLAVKHGATSINLRRPIYPFEAESAVVPPDMLVPVTIDEPGLQATGFLAGYESVIFPAEYRGIAIRVRGVSIGEPGFLGAESMLTGAQKAAMSQITGEVNVLAGLDAVDTLNPGRESFYEESEQFKVLRRHLIGEGERAGGQLMRAIGAVLRRSQVQSAVADVVGRATLRRRALEDVSAAVTHLIAQRDGTASAIRKMLKSKRSELNGLSSADDFEIVLPARVGGLRLVQGKGMVQPVKVDYAGEQIELDMSRKEWDWSLVLFDRSFDVLHKKGKPDQPIAEIDIRNAKILVNWGHPAKPQMDERGFLRMALSFVIAKEAGKHDPRLTIELALRLLSFTSATHG